MFMKENYAVFFYIFYFSILNLTILMWNLVYNNIQELAIKIEHFITHI